MSKFTDIYGHPDTVRHSVRMPYISLLILTFLNCFIPVKKSSINTKQCQCREYFVNLGVLFPTYVDQWLLIPLFTDSYLIIHGLKSGNDPNHLGPLFPVYITPKEHTLIRFSYCLLTINQPIRALVRSNLTPAFLQL